MKNNNATYLGLVAIHIVIGFVIYLIPFLAKIYSPLIILVGLFIIFKTRNKNNEALVIASYIVGVEVLLRMTNSMYINEYGKYFAMIFLFIGMIFQGFPKSGFLYWIFAALLLPGVALSFLTLSFEADLRKSIAFNISGPACLAISSIYCFNRVISMSAVKTIILSLSLPILSTVTYLVFYNPSVKKFVTSTGSNFDTSGGFGPNQVSTVLGLGMFLFFVRFLFDSNSLKMKIINIFFISLLAFRGLVTFSRGGMITGFLMIVVLIIIIYLFSRSESKKNIVGVIAVFFVISTLVWMVTMAQTSGLINNRFANQDAAGRVKKDRLGGREAIQDMEFQLFLDNPITGIGVGKNKEVRAEITGHITASHSEITRMLSEHGILGVLALIILVLTPLITFKNRKQNIFALSLYIFWLLTINHAGMRLAAPGFIYGLSLLKVHLKDEDTIRRE